MWGSRDILVVLEKTGKSPSQSYALGHEPSPLKSSYVFGISSLLLGAGMAPSSSLVLLIPPQDMISLCLVRRQILSSTKPRCLELAPSCVGTQSHSQEPFSFSLQLVSQGGGQLGGSHIEKLGGAWGTLWPWLRSQTEAPPWEFYIMQKWPEKESFVERVASHQAKTGWSLTLLWAEKSGWLFYHLARLGSSPFLRAPNGV